MRKGSTNTTGAADFAQVWDDECELIAVRRGDGTSAEDVKRTACALAFSGGGIRSATFNLGVIQALAELKLLRRFDYLSTVSGGGYIGSWLSTLIRRRADGDVAKAEELLTGATPPSNAPASAPAMPRQTAGAAAIKEDEAIRWLRSYSNYLTPRLGLFRGDSQAAIATWLRNFTLNMTVLAALLGSALLFPRVLQRFGMWLAAQPEFVGAFLTFGLFLLAFPAVLVVTGNLVRDTTGDTLDGERPWYTRGWALALIVGPMLLVAWLGAECLALISSRDYPNFTFYKDNAAWMKYTATIYLAVWLLALLVIWLRRLLIRRERPRHYQAAVRDALGSRELYKWAAKFLSFAAIAGALGGLLFRWTAEWFGSLAGAEWLWVRPWVVFSLGTPLFVVMVLTVIVAHIGLMARNFDDRHHEFWSRIGGYLQTAILLWLLVAGLAAFSAPLIDWLAAWAVGGGVAWVITSLAGMWIGKSAATGSRKSSGWRETFVKLAPYVFVIGFLGFLAWGVQKGFVLYGEGVGWFDAGTCPRPGPVTGAESGIYLRAPQQPGEAVTTTRAITKTTAFDALTGYVQYHSCLMARVPSKALGFAFIVLCATTVLLGFRISVNLYSIHKFYRNRLTRCYLGATNAKRNPNPITGFDPHDDLELKDLKQRPYHILNTAINLNAGRQLAWQRRRAASFAFTPLFTGYEPGSRTLKAGYRPTSEYAMSRAGTSVKVGTAVATSGAAASPNWGFHTDPAVAFLLTVFNVRIGRWCGDTGHRRAWHYEDPRFSLRYWITEMTGQADVTLPFVYLSDGGHFDNLGIYELVRRRCPLIVACDAGADPKYAFEDLGEAIRKCYIDFGVEIAINVSSIIPGKKSRSSRLHYALGEIHYERANNPSPMGRLIYLKSSLTDNLSTDVRHYKSDHPDFPHQTTSDQFFDEPQFESYRKLGYEATLQSIADMKEKGKLPDALA